MEQVAKAQERRSIFKEVSPAGAPRVCLLRLWYCGNCGCEQTPVHNVFLKEQCEFLLNASRENPRRGQMDSPAASGSPASLWKIGKCVSTATARSLEISLHPHAYLLRHQALAEGLGNTHSSRI